MAARLRAIIGARDLSLVSLLATKAVELAYIVVDNARIAFTAPPDPKAGNNDGNAAALTNQLLAAQAQLVQAQNDLYTTWVTFLTTRMELFLDLELFSIDDRGVWTDDAARPAPAARPVAVPNGVGVGVVPPVAADRLGLVPPPPPAGAVVPVGHVEPAVQLPTREPRWRPVR